MQRIVLEEVQSWLQRYRSVFKPPVDIEERVRYNANLSRKWFGPVVALIDQITILSVLLTGSALIRERERGTVEHLLVMPVTPFEIMTSKIWSMGVVVLVRTYWGHRSSHTQLHLSISAQLAHARRCRKVEKQRPACPNSDESCK